MRPYISPILIHKGLIFDLRIDGLWNEGTFRSIPDESYACFAKSVVPAGTAVIRYIMVWKTTGKLDLLQYCCQAQSLAN